MRWKAIKSSFSHRRSKSGTCIGKYQDGGSFVWQRRYWEHTIHDVEDLNRHIDYIYIDPVKHGLLERVADWPRLFIATQTRLIAANWANKISIPCCYTSRLHVNRWKSVMIYEYHLLRRIRG